MKRIHAILAFASLAGLAPMASAITYQFTFEHTVVHETNAFASFATTGGQMGGMAVQVDFTDGTVSNATWAASSATFGAAVAPGLFRVQAGNVSSTTGYPWTFENLSSKTVKSVSFDGQPAGAVFDNDYEFSTWQGSSYVGTPGTSTGVGFLADEAFGFGRLLSFSITYSDPVALQGAPPAGDIFRRMKIEFLDARPFTPGMYVAWRQDVDNLAFDSVLAPVTPPTNGVPDGGWTFALLGAGMAALAGVAGRVNRRAAAAPLAAAAG